MLSQGRKRIFGIAAIVAGIVIVALGVLRPNPLEEKHSYYAEFESAQGLGAIGRDVRLAGVNVGRIGSVEREGDNAVVELILTEDVPVHADARAEMRPHTLFEGSSFVELRPGTPGAPPLDEGGLIPREQTSNYVTLDEALRVLRPEIRQGLKVLARVGSRTLKGKAIEGIQRILKAGPELSRRTTGPVRALQGRGRRELAGTIAGFADTVDAIAGREEELVPMLNRLSRTTAALAVDEAQPFDAALANLPGVLAELRAGAPLLTDMVDRLDRLGVALTPALPGLTDAIDQATPLLDRSIPVLRGATPLIADLRLISRRIANASPDLKSLLRTLGPVVDDFGGSVLPALLEPSRQGAPAYQQLLATFTAATGVFRPYQTLEQNPLGSGHTWSIASYADSTGPLAAPPGAPGAPEAASKRAACADVEAISPKASRQLAVMGVCE